MPSIDDVLQDGSPQRHGCSQPVPPADIYLPGNVWAEPSPVSEGTGGKRESLRPSVPFRVQVLSGSKFYSADTHRRGQAQLNLPSWLPASPRVLSHSGYFA